MMMKVAIRLLDFEQFKYVFEKLYLHKSVENDFGILI